MDNSKFFKTVIIILLLINTGTLAFMWMHHPPHDGPPHERGDVKDFLVHELKLNNDQQNQFEMLKQQHHEAVEELQHKGRKAHDNYFNLLGNPNADSVMVSNGADSIL